MGSNRRHGRLIAGALLAGLLLRLAFGLFGNWQDKVLTHDEQEYLVLALNLAAGRGFTRELPGAFEGPSVESFSRAPLYPAFLAGVFRLTGQATDRLPVSVPRSVQISQALAGLLTIWLIGRLATRAAGSQAGWLAAWTAALYPPLVWSCAYALSEALYTPLLLGSGWVAGRVIDRPGRALEPEHRRQLALAGGLAGVAALTRSSALVFILVTMAWLVWRRGFGLALAMALGAALIVAPWTVRNVMVHGRLIVVAADGGVTFWTGNHPLAIGEGDMAANPHLKAAHVAFRSRLEHLTPEAREPHYYRAAFGYLAAHPLEAAGLVARKFFYTWVPIGPSYRLHSPLYFWTTVFSYVPLLLMACAGVPSLVRAPFPPRALGLAVVSSVLIGLVFFPQDRFRLTVIDPALCVAASAWVSSRLARGEA